MATAPKNSSSKSAALQSKHILVTDKMRQWILSGDVKPGERLPSYNETRAQYGVHTSTMEKVYAKLEAEGLIVRRRGSGTFVAQRGKKAGKTTGIIGLAGDCFSFNGFSPYWAQILGGVRDAVSQAGLQLLILDTKTHNGWEKADGVLVCGWDKGQTSSNRPLDLPMVSLLSRIEGMASVVADDHAGTRAATEHLIKLGHRRIAYLHAYEGQALVQDRLAGYHDALQSAGISASPKWARHLHGVYDVGDQFMSVARRSMLRWQRSGWQKLGCTALLCHNDEVALGAIQALTETGVSVTADMSVMGFDGTEFCDLVSPKLSSVQLPLREIGAKGVELLLQQIEADEISEEHRVLPVGLRAGKTTAPPCAIDKIIEL